eukprot:TRINITY_DN333_c0_g1_i1.p2 TRINITY_DN333_c0_g1~~TRINITY_DN333_c0_g1_i1.p2  ORF type:complete len:175 (-),score=53.60 TRINITY_DN333_c0_g1_i1:269-793(-)
MDIVPAGTTVTRFKWQQGSCRVLEFDKAFLKLFPSHLHPHIKNKLYRVDGGLPINRMRPYAGRFGQIMCQLPFIKTVSLCSMWKLREREVHINVIYKLERDHTGKVVIWDACAQVCWDQPLLPDSSYYSLGSSISDLLSNSSGELPLPPNMSPIPAPSPLLPSTFYTVSSSVLS